MIPRPVNDMKRNFLIGLIVLLLIGGLMLISTSAYKTAITSDAPEERITGTLTLLDNTVYQVTDAMICEDSLYIDEQCVSGEDLQIGNVYAAEMGIGLEIAGLSSDAVDGAVLDLDYGIAIIPAAYDVDMDYYPGDYVSYGGAYYQQTYTSGIVGIIPTNATYWTTVTTAWDDIPLGVFNVTESKRNGIYIDVVATDNMARLAVNATDVYLPARTPEELIDRLPADIYYKPTNTFTNSVSESNQLIVMLNTPPGLIRTFVRFIFSQNTTDDLSITSSLTGPNQGGNVYVKLAKTTASKNTAALIQAGIRALETSHPSYAFYTAVCTAVGNWDTTTINVGASSSAYLYTTFAIKTTTDEFNSYPDSAWDIPATPYVYYSALDACMWIGQVNSTFTRVDRATSQLEMLPLHKSTADRTITKAERYKTTVSDSTVKVTAVQMTINGVVHTVGTTGLTMELRENPFMKSLTSAQIDTALTNILNDITLAEYKPFEMEYIGDPTLQPGDWIVIEDAPTTGGDPTTLITHSTWHYRGHSFLRGVGRTVATIKPVSQVEKDLGALKTEIVTASGSNANGYYVKYADGTMVCTKTIALGSVAVTNAYGALYMSGNQTLGDWAVKFYAVPIATVNVFSANLPLFFGKYTYQTKTVAPVIRILHISSATITVTADVIAIGRWKA